MATTITVRNLDEETQRILKHRAVDNNRSFEAEIRSILNEAAQAETNRHKPTLMEAAERFREATDGLDIVIPERQVEYQREVFA